ncbi:MAG TPA: ABC transporter permease [Verrucomicrobiae bacterium]|nr:ABC transporter permease [Verrucomicrobiae bacterium]
MLPALKEDLRHGLRLLVQKPGFTALVLLALSLAIGANTAIFSLVDAVLFHPLRVPRADELWRVIPIHEHAAGWSYPAYLDLRRAPAVESLCAWSDASPVHLAPAAGRPRRVGASMVSGNYFATLGTRAFLGRLLDEADDASGAAPVVVIGHRLWADAFAGDRGVLGQAVRINGRSFTVAGVAPAGFTGASLESFPDLFLPLPHTESVLTSLAEMKPLTRRGFMWLNVAGVLRPGENVEAAAGQLSGIAVAVPDKDAGPKLAGARLLPAAEAALGYGTESAGRSRLAGRLLFGVVLLVLAIACANVGGMLMVRGERRSREIAIRRAIGASRGRLLRQFMAESALLGVLAAAGGLLVAAWGLDLARAAMPRGTPIPLEAVSSVGDPRVLAYTLVVGLVTIGTLGIIPALSAGRVDVRTALARDASPRVASGHALRELLVATQVALAVVLLAGAGLLLRTLQRAGSVDPGFEVEHRLAATVDPGLQGYDTTRTERVYAELLEAARALPGVRSAALAHIVPMGRRSMGNSVEYEGYSGSPEEAPVVPFNVVSPGFFRTLGIPLLGGRDFDAGDSASSRPVLVVNEAFARRFWPGQDPIGKTIRNMGEGGGLVVGVVRDARLVSPRADPEPFLFLPAAQFHLSDMSLVLETDGEPAALLPGLQALVARLDPDLPLDEAGTLADRLRVKLGPESVLASILGLFAFVALILAATGVYGVTAFATEVRTREFGIRMALGARSRHVLGLVLRRTAWLALGGAMAGLAGVAWLGALFRGLLFGVGSADPATLAATLVLMAAVTFAACLVPARRATRVDPLVALRCE